MLHYLLRRILIGMVTLLLISFLVYALIRQMPGSPLTVMSAEADPSKLPSKEDREEAIRAYGLDKEWYVAYFEWLGNVVGYPDWDANRGPVWRQDWGRSFKYKKDSLQVIGGRVGKTLLLSATSLFLAYLISIPLGLYTSVHSGKLRERSISTSLYILYSLPSFVAALYLQIIFAVRLGLVPLYGIVSEYYDELDFFGKTFDIMWHMILPTICLTYGSLAFYTRFIKSNMGEVIRQDYIRTARAKGVSPPVVIWKHAFRNTLIPFVTMLGLTLPSLLSGAVIIEQIFNWPGMGSLFLESLTARDYPVLMGLVMMFSVLTLMGQLLADILYAVVDPRITYS